jgi:death-on-curing protein
VKGIAWLDSRTIRAIHLALLAEHGGLPGVRDEGLLDSAMARPKNLAAYEAPSLAQLAASYGFGLTKNHPFLDGNKRVGLAAIAVFLDINGYELIASQPDAVTTMLQLAAGDLDEKQLARWIQDNVQLLRV